MILHLQISWSTYSQTPSCVLSLRTSDCCSPNCPWIDATPTAKLLFRKYVPKKLPTTAVHQSGMSSHLCTHYSVFFNISKKKKGQTKKIHSDFYLPVLFRSIRVASHLCGRKNVMLCWWKELEGVGLCSMAFDQQKDHQRIFGVDFVSESVSLNSLGTTAK